MCFDKWKGTVIPNKQKTRKKKCFVRQKISDINDCRQYMGKYVMKGAHLVGKDADVCTQSSDRRRTTLLTTLKSVVLI